MSLLQEFKAFAMRGNVVDLAVGVVIGGAFGKIVTSLVNDIVMPPLNLLTAKSGANFNSLSLKYSQVFGSKIELPKMEKGVPVLDNGKPVIELADPDLLKYGPFLQTTLDFIIVAFAIFMMVRLMNSLQKKKEEAPAAPAPTPEDIALLREIRDSLAKSAPRRAD